MANRVHRRLRYGMIGGGVGSFIGSVHRIAAAMDGEAELIAGALSADPVRARSSAVALGIAPARAYPSYRAMVAGERDRPLAERLDFVVIVTPNHQHFAPAKLFLEAGFNIILDKPATFNLQEAKRLAVIVRSSKKVFVLTHNYIGTATIKEARYLVRQGVLGKVRKVLVEYNQGWLASNLEATGHKQAAWRTDPKRSGAAGCMGDIGTHAEHLLRFVTGLEIESICADLTAFGSGRELDDDGSILIRFRGGARGILHASQICIGEENAFSLRVYGTLASLEWRQEQPNELIVKYPDRPRQTWTRASSYLSQQSRSCSRIPPGHPEGFLEAFANLYLEAFKAIRAELAGQPVPRGLDLPGIDDAVRGMTFIEKVVRSHSQRARWLKYPKFQS